MYTTNLDEYGNLIPLIIPTVDKKGDVLYNYYYKQVNVYGDGNRAVEFNTNFTPSVINNGSIKIQEEFSDEEIVNQFAPQIQEEVVPLPTEVSQPISEKPEGISQEEWDGLSQEEKNKIKEC